MVIVDEYDDDDDDFDPSEYVQPDSPEALKFKDGAKLIYCKMCSVPMMVPAKDDDVWSCGRHEKWRTWFARN